MKLVFPVIGAEGYEALAELGDERTTLFDVIEETTQLAN